RRKRLHSSHRSVRFILQGPERELYDRSEREDGSSVIAKHAVKSVEGVEQGLTDQFEKAELHHLRFVVLHTCEAMVKFRPGVNLEMRAVGLTRLQVEPAHVHGTFDAEQFLRRIDVKTLSPDRVGFF